MLAPELARIVALQAPVAELANTEVAEAEKRLVAVAGQVDL